jgi:putative membrane protein
MAPYYLWLKAFHIIAVVCWMAGLLYLPRLYVYHADAEKGSDKSETFKIMERRLLRGIINPSMIAVWITGPLLIMQQPAFAQQGWFHVKFLCVLLLSAIHGLYAKWRRIFERDENTRPAKFYRIWNEIPVLLLVVIVIMVAVKPF